MKKLTSFLLAMLMFTTSIVGFSSCEEKEVLNAKVLPVKDGCKGIITIVHDDGDLPSARFLVEEFEKNDLRGNLAPKVERIMKVDGTLTADAEEWKQIMATGLFEMANHTQTHTFYGFTDDGEEGVYLTRAGQEVAYKFEPGHMTEEIIGAAERLREVFPDQRVLTYIIPGFGNQGEWNGRTEIPMKMIEENFISQRNTGGSADYNGEKIECLNNLDKLNYESLNSMMVNASDDYRIRWFDYVDNTINYGGWGIYCFHNIWEQEVPSGHNVAQSKASELFEYIGDKVAEGSLWCATMEEGTMYTKEASSARVTLEEADGSISVKLHDKLDNELYDMPLTLEVDVYKAWTKAAVTVNGETAVYDVNTRDDGTKYIWFDLVPDSGNAVIAKAE